MTLVLALTQKMNMGLTSPVELAQTAVSRVQWLCPVCAASLTLQGRTWQCEQLHSFDCAKEGYVNLLLAQRKNSKSPGDNKDMVVARQAFLVTQSYRPLADVLASVVNSHLQHFTPKVSRENPLLFDLGCSEGYYSALIQQLIISTGAELDVAGLDISKPAVQRAAKKYKQNQYAVASSFNIPLAAQSVDVVLQVFAPSASDEVKRVLRADGKWLVVEPAANHLQELKSFVYDQANSHDVKQEIPSGFSLVEQQRVSFSFTVDNQADRLNLLKMTPYYWRISPENKARLLEKLSIISADFTVKQFCLDAPKPESKA